MVLCICLSVCGAPVLSVFLSLEGCCLAVCLCVCLFVYLSSITTDFMCVCVCVCVWVCLGVFGVYAQCGRRALQAPKTPTVSRVVIAINSSCD